MVWICSKKGAEEDIRVGYEMEVEGSRLRDLLLLLNVLSLQDIDCHGFPQLPFSRYCQNHFTGHIHPTRSNS